MEFNKLNEINEESENQDPFDHAAELIIIVAAIIISAILFIAAPQWIFESILGYNMYQS